MQRQTQTHQSQCLINRHLIQTLRQSLQNSPQSHNVDVPTSPPTPCRHIGCNRVLPRPGYCSEHAKQHQKTMNAIYQHSHEHNVLYGRRWRGDRNDYLRAHPLCVRCGAAGRHTLATVVDHIQPHNGDMKLFTNSLNWQSLCKTCHDAKTASEDGGFGNKIKKVVVL